VGESNKRYLRTHVSRKIAPLLGNYVEKIIEIASENGTLPQPENDQLPSITIADLPPQLQTAVRNAGWQKLMPVQARAVPYVLNRQDVIVQARTGSGKTGAFVLPILDRIDPDEATCQALILVPTRELAKQVAEQADILGMGSGVRSVAVYGGVAYGPQRAAFEKGAHIVIGTPGRILDHLMRGNFNLDRLRMLIFDEADRMLSVGFYPDMKQVKRFLPPDRAVNACMFSATFPPHVMRLAHEFTQDAVTLSLSSDHVHVTNVEHVVYTIIGLDKDRTLVRLLEIENPDSAIIFCNTKNKVNYVATVLQRFGYNADQLSGDLSQAAREQVLQRIRDGKLRFLVATDVAARGIDIPELSHVFQYEVPENPEPYIHRAGRTGRAGAAGTAIMLVETLDQIRLGKIVKMYDVDLLEPESPTDDDVAEVVAQRTRTRLESRLRELSAEERQKLEQYEPMAELLTTNADGIRALAMLLDDYYHESIFTIRSAEDAPSVPVKPNFEAVNDNVMQKIAESLLEDMQVRDKLRLERLMRFVPLVELLAMRGDSFYGLMLLLHNYHVQLDRNPKKQANKKDDKRSDKRREKPTSRRRSRNTNRR
jgi:ATP-dependent RNA helicase DeaD